MLKTLNKFAGVEFFIPIRSNGIKIQSDPIIYCAPIVRTTPAGHYPRNRTNCDDSRVLDGHLSAVRHIDFDPHVVAGVAARANPHRYRQGPPPPEEGRR